MSKINEIDCRLLDYGKKKKRRRNKKKKNRITFQKL